MSYSAFKAKWGLTSIFYLVIYHYFIGGLIIVSIMPDKIANIRFNGGRLLRIRAPDKKTAYVRFLIRLFYV